MFGQGHGFVQDKDSGQSHEVLKIINLAKIMAWLWYEVGDEDGYELGCDYGQDILRASPTAAGPYKLTCR